MRVIRVFSVFIVAASTTIVLTSTARAQESRAALLTADEVVQLVAAPDSPARHTRLADHYAAVAAGLEARATGHRAMADVYRRARYGSESKRPGAPDTSAHCERLARHAADAAAEARRMATSHEVSAAYR